jgi:ketosteroid isomerase-like protein
MKNHPAIRFPGGVLQAVLVLFFGVVLFSTWTLSTAAEQKDKKKKKDNSAAADSANLIVPLSDEQQVDYMISEMLGAWQIGDIDRLHKDYADDVSIVNGSWEPPFIGWPSYLAVYQQQRARRQQVRMDRSNTYIKVDGTVAWACYQWDFSATVDGQPVVAQGHTTLVLEKRNNHWVIVHNHTSLVPSSRPATPVSAPTPAPPGQTDKTPSP